MKAVTTRSLLLSLLLASGPALPASAGPDHSGSESAWASLPVHDSEGGLLPIWLTATAPRDGLRVSPPFSTFGPDLVTRSMRRPDFPGELMRERWAMLTAGDETATGQDLIEAKDELELNDARLRRSGALGVLDAGLGNWEWMGPENIGGRTRAILFDPNDANHLWAGAATGGIATSFDGGFSWTMIDDFLPSLSVTSLVIDTDSGTLFAATGEFAEQNGVGTATGGTVSGAGVFRSTDNGATWTQLPATAGWIQTSRLAMVPGDDFLYAATSNGLLRSSNLGDTWSLVLNMANLRDVKATPTTHVVMVGSAAGAFRSGDSGATWTTLHTGATGLLPADAGRVEFALGSNETTIFASVDRASGEVWRSLDAGATWTRRRTGDLYLGNQGWYDNAIWVDPTNPNVVAVAGIDAWRSTDGGANFTKISTWWAYPGASAHADHHVIVSHPGYNGTTNRRVYFGNDGGVQRKDDILTGDEGWTNLSNGLRTTQFYKGAIQPGTNELMGGLQDNGTWRRTGSNTWVNRFGGDGGYCAYSADLSTHYWQYVNLELWKPGVFGIPGTCIGGLTDAQNGCTARFIAPFKSDPVVAGRMFAGGRNLWRSTNFADSWTSVRGPVNHVPNPTPGGCPTMGPLCSAIELVSSNASLVWAGYSDGTLSRSTDNGVSWVDLDGGATPLPDRIVTDIAINPSNTNEVWVTFGGFSASNVWFTSDGGSTWSVRSGSGSTGLPAVAVETIVIHPSNRSWIYAGTALGVLGSQDKGLTWGLMRSHEQSEGPAYTQVSDLHWEGNRLVAFTYGRGVWRSGPISGGSSGPAIALLGASLSGTQFGSIEWGDVDGDGDLDVIWTGNRAVSDTLPPSPATYLGRNNGAGTFTQIIPGLPQVWAGAARLGDYDGDGDLDVAISGERSGPALVARVYRNSGGVFSDIFGSFEPVAYSDQVWGDFDNDGDLDLVIAGRAGPAYGNAGLTRLYVNTGGSFSASPMAFVGVQHASLDAGDYDGDGDLDLLVAGWQGATTTPVTILYRNDGGVFMNAGAGLPGVEYSAEFGDYDEDGDLDLLLMGSNALWVIRNNGGGIYVPILTLAQQLDGQASWGDYDNDGDLDIAVNGREGAANVTRLYRNDAGAYVDTGARLNGARRASLAWADFDGDGDVDLFQTGWASVANVAQVYRNDIAVGNAIPFAPSGLAVNTSGCIGGRIQVNFSWGAGNDDRTATAALGYNLRIGTTPGANDVFASQSEPVNHRRQLAARGNAQQRRTWTLSLPPGEYHWSVQTVDAAFQSSVFVSGPVARVATHYADAGAAITPTTSTVAFGDYDGDDLLDLLVTGVNGSDIWRNLGNGGGFSPVGAGLPTLDYTSSAWGDYDRDGDLDLVITGCASGIYVTRIYRNTGGSFADIGAGLPGLCGGTAAWADIDRDGDLDLLLTGASSTGSISRLYINEQGIFYDLGMSLPGVSSGRSAFGDFDGDGDLDLLITGFDDSNVRHADLYRNDGGGGFTAMASGLPGVAFGTAAWADFDRDGDEDLLLTGSTGVGADQIARVYRSNGDGSFTDLFAGLPGIQEGSSDWGDLDNDGRLDILLTGYNPTVGRQARVFYGTAAGGFLAAAGTGLPSVFSSDADLGDSNGDGILDVALSGLAGPALTKVFLGCGAPSNAPPAVPAGLAWSRNGDQLTLSWSAASDDHDATGTGLTYNVRVGTSPGGQQILSAMSNPATGFHRIGGPGNTRGRRSITLTLPDQRCYWSVQAVDPGYRSSAFAPPQTLGIVLESVAAGFPGLYRSAMAWGDYDGDGDLDLVMCGSNGFGPVTKLYRNNGGGSFTDMPTALPNVEWGSVDWGDFDRDGDLDLAICGWNAGPLVTRIYRNDAGTFTDIATDLPGVLYGTVAWGDADGDGDLDLFTSGYDGSQHQAGIYIQRNGRFALKYPVEGVAFTYADWGDVDEDGDLDLAVMGHNGTQGITRVYRNDGGNGFVNSGLSLPGAWEGSLCWGDYDADGDLDLLINGWTGSQRFTEVYRNSDNLLIPIGANVEGASSSRSAWADYDNDGDLDIAVTGYIDAGVGMTRVYRKDAAGYVDTELPLPNTYYSSLAWGDFDNDHDVDLALTGLGVAGLYMNDGAPPNLPPSAPVGLNSSVNGNVLTLTWSPATDDHTPAASLSYNVRLGTTPGGGQLVSAMAQVDGWRQVPKLGNAQLRLSLPVIQSQTSGYWSVQAIDGAHQGSAFATEIPTVLGSESVALPIADALGPATPNPLRTSTNIALALARTGPVEIDLYSVTGQRVATLFRGPMSAGHTQLRWSPRSASRASLPAGVYLLRLKASGQLHTLKLLVMQ